MSPDAIFGIIPPLVTPPCYFEMTQAELLRYYRLVADHSATPLILRHVPQYTIPAIEPFIA